LCNPKISTLLKAVGKGFLKGCPNLREKLILKYLNPSPATTKGHMKRMQYGIKNTHPKPNATVPQPLPVVPPPVWVPLPDNFVPPAARGPNVINDDCDKSIANVFCYGTFANRHSEVVYNNLTGSFPFVLFNGSMCFLVMYYYESNAIMATPIAGLDDQSIFNAYKQIFMSLREKGSSQN
jgi:hypothetical protein